MCLWLLTACLGLLPANPSPAIIVVSGVPAPILQPTTAATTTAATTTRAPMPGNMTMPPMPGNMTMPPMPGNMTMPPMPGNMTMPPMPGNMTMPPMPGNMTMPPMPGNMTMPPMPGNMTMPPMPGNMTMPTTPRLANSSGAPPPAMTSPTTAATSVMTPAPLTTAGPIPIDPRVGSTPPAPSAALREPPITGYSGQIPSYDTAVRFPRQKRNVEFGFERDIKDFLMNVHNIGSKHEIRKRETCTCVPTGTCIRTGSNYGAGMIDFRIVSPGGTQCPSGQEYCCGNTTASTEIGCGKVQTVPATSVTPAAGQASFGEYPWVAIILTKQNDYIAGGVLIDKLNVITVTHRLIPYIVSGTAPNVKVRLGEWDAAGTYEPVPFQEYTIQKVFSHPSYNANTLQYDITVLRLSAPVPFTPATSAATTINRACLPPSSTTAYNGQRCWVAGWGKNMFGVQGQYQQIMKKVDVPIVAPATCQTQLQAARLGSNFTLDTTSFLCAGGEANKDSCTGDGGSGLVCQAGGQWTVVGLVAWGLGCATANVSAAYVNVAAFLPWIQQQLTAA